MIENEEFVLQMKKLILDALNELFKENILDYQAWEYLKYNIRKYTILRYNFSKKRAKNTNKKIADLEIKLKHFKKHYHEKHRL